MAPSNQSRHRAGHQQPASKKFDGINSQTAKASCDSMSSSLGHWSPGTYTALKALLSARLCAAVWGIITDCDETFNYWEPMHFVLYGKGMQTWEYAPQYALRSYFYLLLHAAPAWLYDAIVTSNRVLVFFFVRCLLAMLSSACELYFYKGVLVAYGPRVARSTLCLLVFSTGMFAASTAFLPSSFAMQAVACGMGAWLQRQHKLAIFCYAVAALLGWPFAAVLGAPVAYDIVVRKGKLKLFLLWSFLSAVIILVPMVQLDSLYYGRLVVAPLQLVLYNVFTAHGPDLYGTEPWSFYVINGFLNFNLAFLLALAALPLLCLSVMCGMTNGRSHAPEWLSLAGLYLWLAVFFLQPHKEERFLFPVYPLICLAAAMALESVERLLKRLPLQNCSALASYVTLSLLVTSSVVSLSRSVGQYRSYHAPLDIFLELQRLPAQPSRAVTRLCLGKEWHRFPSSFFLPNDRWELHFIKSSFKGQLPQHFLQTENATAIERSNFNDLNLEETDRYVNAESCHYLIDQDTPEFSHEEPRYSTQTKTWSTVTAVPFLDKLRSPALFRAFYIPYLTDVYCEFNNYTLLENIALFKRRKNT
ncbi:alpha-1,2-mannosyltransferase ALG9 [Hyalella azteca]|uniref:Mannosyltransferase n=1 Tax=Hyalella azteca TaxID=294128 RepID=A0A8B7PCT1_HYAAZ|nr:alpha-1,2-mannosyltransferase ALG9 [Hyalella azteca]